jgi:hypothetical protein
VHCRIKYRKMTEPSLDKCLPSIARMTSPACSTPAASPSGAMRVTITPVWSCRSPTDRRSAADSSVCSAGHTPYALPFVWVCLLCFVRCTVASPCRSGHVRLDGPHKAQLRRRSPARIREAGEGRPTAVWYQQPLVVDSTVPYSARAPIVLRVRNGAAGRVGRCCIRTTGCARQGKAKLHSPESCNRAAECLCTRRMSRPYAHDHLTNRSIEQYARTFDRIKASAPQQADPRLCILGRRVRDGHVQTGAL